MGRLTTDPELKTTSNGVSVTSFNVAVDRNYVKQGEERKTDFFTVVCWRQTAEFVSKYFKRGNLIAVEGQLQSRVYQAKDGSNRYVVEVIADNVSFTGERHDTQTAQPATQTAQPQQAPANWQPQQQAQPQQTQQSFEDIGFEDLPF